MNYLLAPIKFQEDCLFLLDQRKLPLEETYIKNTTLQDGFDCIKEMVVRGAPCIGFTAIFSLALWVKNNPNFSLIEFRNIADYLKTARPTAVNLAYEIDRTVKYVEKLQGKTETIYENLVSFGFDQIHLLENNNKNMALLAHKEILNLYPDKKINLMTHCNTGFLACGTIGTALGTIQYLAEMGKVNKVWVDETRPYFQGSRLTSFELSKLGISHDIVVEGCAGYLISKGLVDAIFVGADRIVSNGDTANKIGTFNLAIIAKSFDIPFYVVAPSSSFDLSLNSGDQIEIELRDQQEILSFKEVRIASESSTSFNPSFDITQSKFITGIICEHGLIKPPFNTNIRKVVKYE